jgi:hypothetical protein
MTAINSYCTRAEFLAWIAATTATSATDDPVVDEILEETSRYCDDTTGRRFYPLQKTYLLDIPSSHYPNSDTLVLTDDLLSLTTLTNGDATVIAAANYNLIPVNDPPYFAIQLKDVASVTWATNTAGSKDQVISVAGIWGYHPEYATRAWSIATTLNGAITDTTGLVWNVVSGTPLTTGCIVKIDNEFLIVASVAVNAVTFVARGDNGSTAATHLTGATVYLWNTVKPIKSAVFQIALSLYKRRHGESISGIASVTAAGVVITPTDVPQLAQRILMQYSRFS